MSKPGSRISRRREVIWAVVRLLLGLIQIAGATTSVLLLLGSGVNRVTCTTVIITGFFTLLSRILFPHRNSATG